MRWAASMRLTVLSSGMTTRAGYGINELEYEFHIRHLLPTEELAAAMRCALVSMRPTDLIQDWYLSRALMSTLHGSCRLTAGVEARSVVITTAPMLMSELPELGAPSSPPPSVVLGGTVEVSCSSGGLEASSYAEEVRAAPRYGHVLTTTLSRKGVPIMMVRHLACFRLGTSAVLSEHVHLVHVSTAKCPPLGHKSESRSRRSAGGMPAT